MRVAAIYDIHGNLPALEAVLHEIYLAGVDQIVAGGDVVLGPMSCESLNTLLELNIPVNFIQGNCEVSVLAQTNGKDPGPLPQDVLESVRWTAEQMLPEHEQIMSSWPKTLQLEIPGLGKVLFCHATPRSENECFTCLTPESKLTPIFEKTGADLVVCGHTHMQFERNIGGVRIANAGSVGMPFGQPGAHWLMLGPGVEFKNTQYNYTEAAKRIRVSKYPQAEDFASNNVLSTPTQENMLELFSRFELE